MPDIPFRLRRSLFDSTPMSGINPASLNFSQSQQEEPQGNDYNLTDIYSKIANTEPGPAQKRYRDFLDNETPTREKYKPSKTSRIAAILGGVSEGVEHGAGRGLQTTYGVMDRGYDNAVSDFKMGADRLGKSADLEEKDINNRVKTFRDIIQDVNSQRDDARKSKLVDAQIGNYKSLASDRESQQKTRGWNFFTDDSPGGHRYGVRVGANGMEKVDAGVGSPSLDDIGNVEKTKEGARFSFRSRLAAIRGEEQRKGIRERFSQAKDLVKFKTDNPSYKFEVLSDGSIVGINPKDPYDIQHTGLNAGKLGDKEKAELGIASFGKKAEITEGVQKKKEERKAATQTVKTTEEKGGKTTTTTSTETKKVRMIDPDGKVFDVDPSEVAEAEKHNWKKK